MKNKIIYLATLLICSSLMLQSCKKKSDDNDASTSVTDVDGNAYKARKIGSQVWMSENLKVKHYRNGDAIPNITDLSQWSGTAAGAWCAYDNDLSLVPIYGLLYNRSAVIDSRNIAPDGWRIPTNDDFKILISSLGGPMVANGALKEEGISHWLSPNSGATNSSSFTALPGGRIISNWGFSDIGEVGGWWTTSLENLNQNALFLYLDYMGAPAVINQTGDSHDAMSVRCIKE